MTTIHIHNYQPRRTADRKRARTRDAVVSPAEARDILRAYLAGNKSEFNSIAQYLNLPERSALIWLREVAQSRG